MGKACFFLIGPSSLYVASIRCVIIKWCHCKNIQTTWTAFHSDFKLLWLVDYWRASNNTKIIEWTRKWIHNNHLYLCGISRCFFSCCCVDLLLSSGTAIIKTCHHDLVKCAERSANHKHMDNQSSHALMNNIIVRKRMFKVNVALHSVVDQSYMIAIINSKFSYVHAFKYYIQNKI